MRPGADKIDRGWRRRMCAAGGCALGLVASLEHGARPEHGARRERGDGEADAPASQGLTVMPIIAMAFAAGIALGGAGPRGPPPPLDGTVQAGDGISSASSASFASFAMVWAVAALVALAVAAVGAARRARCAWWLVALAAGGAGGAWAATRSEHVALEALARVEGDMPAAWFGGIALSPPRMAERRGSMAEFDPRPPRWRFELDVDSMTVGGRREAVRGRAWVSIAGAVVEPNEWTSAATPASQPASGSRARSHGPPAVRPGDRVEVFGQFTTFRPPRNPGEFDGAAWARANGIAGTVWVDDMAAVRGAFAGAAEARRVGDADGDPDGDADANPDGNHPVRSAIARFRNAARELARSA